MGHGHTISTLYPFEIELLLIVKISHATEREWCLVLPFTHVPSVCYTSVNGELNSKIPFSDSQDAEVQAEEVIGVKEMLIPVLAGILSALRRVIARRVSLKVLTFFCYVLCIYPVSNISTKPTYTLKKEKVTQVDIGTFAFYDSRINLKDG